MAGQEHGSADHVKAVQVIATNLHARRPAIDPIDMHLGVSAKLFLTWIVPTVDVYKKTQHGMVLGLT
jgi:hypothetical protein